jgi:MFS family permease
MRYNKPPGFLLFIIVFSQFAGTSLWFAGNAIISDIQQHIASGSVANITSIVQFGFIAGTLAFSLLTIADRYPASKVFFFSSLIASAANCLLIWFAYDNSGLYILRFVTGFFLAGIYPVGMKISADQFPQKLGKALGYLVGALVLGTALPYILKAQLHSFRWQDVLLFTSALALSGSTLILLFVPHTKKHGIVNRVHLSTAFTVFKSANFRAASFGYFGHMWELYALWAFVPIVIKLYTQQHQSDLNNSFWSFFIIASGCLGCIVGGIISQRTGSKKVAFYSLVISGACCLFSPFLYFLPPALFLVYMLIWGITVVADSPQFSTLVAQSAPSDNKGTALTIVTSIGFAITIVSIQLLKLLFDALEKYGLLLLLIGPIAGLLTLKRYRSENRQW